MAPDNSVNPAAGIAPGPTIGFWPAKASFKRKAADRPSSKPRGLMNRNLDVVRRAYQAFAVGDVPSVLSVFSPSIHWTEAEGGPYGGIYIGPDAVLENVFMKLGGEWDSFSAVPSEFVSDGATVVALGEYSGTYKATGKSFKAPFAHVWKFMGGMAASFHQYTDTVVHQRPLHS